MSPPVSRGLDDSLQIDQSGAVVIEDRQNIAYAVPARIPTQLLDQRSLPRRPWQRVSVAPCDSVRTAVARIWQCVTLASAYRLLCPASARPITLSESLVSEGHSNITSGPSHIIAAILYAISPITRPCSATLIQHAAVGSVNVTLL